MTKPEPAQRSWLDVRWRQLRNPPPPVLRAVLADLGVAVLGGAMLFVYALLDSAADMLVPIVVFIAAVVVAGSLLTYLWVELPTGAKGQRRRSAWAMLLGLFASLPIAYLALVVVFQVLLSGR